MNITIKKIIALLLILPLILLIGFLVYSMHNNQSIPFENPTQNSGTTTSPEPSFENESVLSASITGKYIFSNNTYTLDLQTKSTSTINAISIVSDDIKWILHNNDMSLTISTYVDESPFSTNSDIEIVSIKSPQLGRSLFRIPIQDNYYFYSDNYSKGDCGDKHCSNGLVSIPNSEFIEILCESKKQEGLNQCDELVENLDIVNIY